jgi:hypothetical protein
MKPAILTVLLAASLAFTLPAPHAAAQGGECLTDRAIQQAIAGGEIRSWAAIRRMAGVPSSFSEVSNVQLCRRGGGLYYVVSVVSPSGEARRLVLNAVDGSQ